MSAGTVYVVPTDERAYCGNQQAVCKGRVINLDVAEQSFKNAVIQAARQPRALESVEALYRSVQEEVDRRRPLCVVSGRCCRFEEFGHRLFVTTLELARFVHDSASVQAPQDWDGTGCPFQRAKLCTVHAIRPFGCRMFFCDATSTEWQNAAYERFHSELKMLHETLGVPYFYMEWRHALRALGIGAKGNDL